MQSERISKTALSGMEKLNALARSKKQETAFPVGCQSSAGCHV